MFSSIIKYSSAIFCFFILFSSFQALAQDNSPYSRYGLGDMVPTSNVANRGMGGISAAYSEFLTTNFNNPASYSSFRTFIEEKSKRPVSGRVLLDAGINLDSRTLRNPNQPEKFSSTYAAFSYVQLGIPLRNNWGLSFGLRPISKISYKVDRRELLFNNQHHDSAYTQFNGEGGAFLPYIGTGFAIKNFSIGANFGYLFGKKEFSSTRAIFSDSAAFNTSKHNTLSSFGDIFLHAGAQYRIKLSKQTSLSLGISGNLKQNINASQDRKVETIVTTSSGDVRQDSVFEQTGIPGEIIFPATYTTGFVLQNVKDKGNGWLLGADYVQSKWEEYRFFGQKDSVQDSWQVRVGGHFRPEPTRSYFSNVTYRAGFFFGPDYIKVRNELPQFGVSFGLGLPVANFNRSSMGQYTIINLALEYSRRGNDDNSLKENLFRLSVGLNFSDLWFNKRRYD